jgi:hypothetical protein
MQESVEESPEEVNARLIARTDRNIMIVLAVIATYVVVMLVNGLIAVVLGSDLFEKIAKLQLAFFLAAILIFVVTEMSRNE